MVGQFKAEKLTNRKAVRTFPGDSALALDPFKVANQEDAKIDAGWNPGATTDLAVVGTTELLDPSIETRTFQQLIEFRVEAGSVRTGQIYSGDEQVLLLNGLASTKGNLAIFHSDCVDRHRFTRNRAFQRAFKVYARERCPSLMNGSILIDLNFK
jgi:hypothetical protein